MLLRDDQHIPDTLACTLLAECHLQDGRVYWLPGDLTTQLVELPMGDFEVCRRVFVLHIQSVSRQRRIDAEEHAHGHSYSSPPSTCPLPAPPRPPHPLHSQVSRQERRRRSDCPPQPACASLPLQLVQTSSPGSRGPVFSETTRTVMRMKHYKARFSSRGGQSESVSGDVLSSRLP